MTSDWTVHEGQAVWRPKGAAGIAGELLVATNSTGDFVVEFAKPPISIVTAQRAGGLWQFEFPAQQKTYRGRGDGPSRVIWLRLVPALAGRGGPWRMTTNSNGWRLENRRGESLEGFLSP